MSNEAFETQKGLLYMKQVGRYINVYSDKDMEGDIQYKINIPLFHKIALFATRRRAYKTVLSAFFEELRHENIRGLFATREDLERATQACGAPGGRVAFLLGLFCRYYGKLPRNVNFVKSNCENCNRYLEKCGELSKCGDYYGCGDGVLIPMDNAFDAKAIPKIRRSIASEVFPCPETE